MRSSVRAFPNVSRVVMLAPQAAAAAFDVMILDPATAVDLLPAGGLYRAEPTGYAPLRVLPATLHLHGRFGGEIGVILELLPFATQRCELSMYPIRGARPWCGGVETWLTAAHRALDALAALMIIRPADRVELPAPREVQQSASGAAAPRLTSRLPPKAGGRTTSGPDTPAGRRNGAS